MYALTYTWSFKFEHLMGFCILPTFVYAGFAAVALASCTRRVDYKLACFVFSSLSGHARSSVPRRRHTSGLRRSSTAATFFHRQIVCRSTHTQHFRRQELRCRRATCLEQSSGPLARRGHYKQQFQA